MPTINIKTIEQSIENDSFDKKKKEKKLSLVKQKKKINLRNWKKTRTRANAQDCTTCQKILKHASEENVKNKSMSWLPFIGPQDKKKHNRHPLIGVLG